MTATFTTHHCITGSMLRVFRHAGVDLSEDMLLGLGAGVGFFYWHMKGMPPMLLGRGNVHRPGTEGLEVDTSRRLGVGVERFVTSSSKKAHTALLAELEAGRPVMMQVDMGFLPYFDFPEEYHFGGHVIVVLGMEGEAFLVADRDEVIHRVGEAALREARGSKHKPFPPAHMWYRFDFSAAHPPSPEGLRAALAQNADAMLHGPIANLGVRGIEKAAGLVPKWPSKLSEEVLRRACLENFIFIDATGGTGGGMFRLMYGRFLREAAALLETPELETLAAQSTACGHAWDAIAEVFSAVSEGQRPPDALGELKPALLDLAAAERSLWEGLAALAE